MKSFNTVAKVFLTCCLNAFIMEVIMAKAPKSANLVTFLQFIFISVHGFAYVAKFGKVKPNIPLKQYAILVALFFVSSVANNYVYALHVPSTLHMIIRSASSPASMLVYCHHTKTYPKRTKAVGSVLITIGVGLATYGGAPPQQADGRFTLWCLGVVVLVSTLITGAYTGLQQEMLYAKYGKHPSEMLFYTHALPLPIFLALSPQLHATSSQLTNDIWLLIILNVISQFYCTHSVHELATKENSVTVTFILTVRKFISLLVSAVVFKNNLTVYHLVGTFLVAVGTCVYFDYFAKKRQEAVKFK